MLKQSGHQQQEEKEPEHHHQQIRTRTRRYISTSGFQMTMMMIFCAVLLLLCPIALTTADDEVVAGGGGQPRVAFKNDEYVNRKQIPDVQSLLQKPLTDKKFENLNTFLDTLKSSLTEAGYRSNPGECMECEQG